MNPRRTCLGADDKRMQAHDDHQVQQPLVIATWVKTNGRDVKHDQENTGYGWRTDQKIDTYSAAQPSSCQMKRPGA